MAKGQAVNAKFNTISDRLMISKEMSVLTKELNNILSVDYFIFMVYRQENLMNKEFVEQAVRPINKVAEKRKCVLILHKIMKNALIRTGIFEKLKDNPSFILLP